MQLMQLLPILIAIVLGILALAFVLYPLYKRTPAPRTGVEQTQTGPGDQTESTLADREQAARTALQEIELDYQLGNIVEPDYRTLRERYVRRALVALKSRYDREQELDEMIEMKLQKMKEHDDGSAEQ